MADIYINPKIGATTCIDYNTSTDSGLFANVNSNGEIEFYLFGDNTYYNAYGYTLKIGDDTVYNSTINLSYDTTFKCYVNKLYTDSIDDLVNKPISIAYTGYTAIYTIKKSIEATRQLIEQMVYQDHYIKIMYGIQWNPKDTFTLSLEVYYRTEANGIANLSNMLDDYGTGHPYIKISQNGTNLVNKKYFRKGFYVANTEALIYTETFTFNTTSFSDLAITLQERTLGNKATTLNGFIPRLYTINLTDGNTLINTFYLKQGSAWYSDYNGKNQVTSITPLKKSGYIFNGFYQASNKIIDENGSFLSSTFTTVDTILSAKWTEIIITLTLNTGEGSIITPGTEKLYFKWTSEKDDYFSDINCTTKIIRINKPIRKDYNFKGYYTSYNRQIIDAGGNIVSDNWSFVENSTLFAQWEESETILINQTIQAEFSVPSEHIYYKFIPPATINYILKSFSDDGDFFDPDCAVYYYNQENNRYVSMGADQQIGNFNKSYQLTKGVEYYIRIIHNSTDEQDIIIPFSIILENTVKIYTDQGWKSTIPFIYTGSEEDQGWKPSIPYIWDGTAWKTCK